MKLLGAGRAILWRHTPGSPFHLWFVLTDPSGSPETVIAVCLKSKKRFTDDTVILGPGDHPFIRRESSVAYSTAGRFRVKELTAALAAGTCHLKEDMSAELLERVRAGLLKSQYTVNAIRQECQRLFEGQITTDR